MITFKFKQLLTALLCILCIPASAQFQKSVEQYVNSSWANVSVDFTMTEIAEVLGTDAATLAGALDAWAEAYETGTQETNLFFLNDPTDPSKLIEDYTQGGPGGFWINNTGIPAAWGTEDLMYFNMLEWGYGSATDEEGNETGENEDYLSIIFGQMPDVMPEGATFNPHFTLKYNGKEATFDITYIVNPLPSVPEIATNVIADLNIVGEAFVSATRTDIQGYDATQLSVDATEIIEKLGVDASLFGAQLSTLLYTELRDTELGVCADTLSHNFTAGAPGWWLQRVLYPQGHEQQGEESPNVAAAPYGNTCHIFLEAFAYNTETNAITCNLGQYPGTPKAGEFVDAHIYILYGDKAYRVTYHVDFAESEAISLADMTNTGNTDFNLTFNDSFADYQTININVDIDNISTLLECPASEMNFTGLKDEEGLWVGDYTANGGYYFDMEGFVGTWGANASFFIQPTDETYSTFQVGLMAGKQANVGETYSAKVYFVNGSSYYTLTINCAIEHKESDDQSTWEIVEKKPAIVQVIAASTEDGYITDGNQTVYTLTPEQINDIIGTTSPVMYVHNHDTIVAATGEVYAPYTKYPCDPRPGAWFNKDGWGQLWAGNAEVPVGICWNESTGAFSVYQVPGIQVPGNTFTAPIFFVNEENQKLIEVDFTVQFVDELKSQEVVGTESILLPVSEFMDDMTVDIDLEKPAAAFGISVEELLNAYGMKGMKSSGLYSEGQDPINMGLTFDRNGFYDEYGMIYLNVIEEGDAYQLLISCSEEVDENFRTSATFCFEYNDQIYVYNATFLSETAYTDGIEDVKADVKAGNDKVYDLSGRQVNNPTQKGIYIKNGKKFIVK